VESSNFFDDLLAQEDPSETLRIQKEQESKGNHLDYLVHKVFFQNENGAELLKIWKEALIMSPTAYPNSDLLSVGINEGHKQFIRSILLTIERVNDAT